ncbi:MAG: hypothetical protein JJU46_05300 [Balneolaceae bacterium]|nr:hypothetical protein [Balneolaceae bacterium]MCH8549135.1 hypothetical protein [Balneolaceae bacterium]
MWILTLFLSVLFLIAGFAGNRDWFTLDKLSRENVLNSTLIVLAAFTLLMVAYVLGFFPQSIAAPFMMSLYVSIAGFFIGYGVRLINSRSDAGAILYQHRSFWIDHAPNFLAVGLILYGFFRMAILTDQPITGIRLTSGLSLISFGFFTWTLKAVPEFRSGGLILLDRYIKWPKIISWNWQSESVLSIEYIVNRDGEDRIRQFATYIPEEERKEIELILKSKMDEYDKERKKVLGISGEE